MHKRYLNYCTLEITLKPDNPLLIKSGEEGADPTKPDMEFLETFHKGKRTIYLPGSSLKGAIRAHCERIVRSIGDDKKPQNDDQLWANDPVNDNYNYLEEVKSDPKARYKKSSFTDQMFGNTYIASRIRIEDGYPIETTPIKLEERNGVAIDRVFGSVAVGPFNYQVCTQGEFKAKIHLKNFTLSQLALIGLTLRDLDQGWFNLGFGKSRGLGSVKVDLQKALVTYPSCVIKDNQICFLGQSQGWEYNQLLGVGEFLDSDECEQYGFQKPDYTVVPIAGQEMDFGIGVQLNFSGEEAVKTLFLRSVNVWKHLVESQVN